MPTKDETPEVDTDEDDRMEPGHMGSLIPALQGVPYGVWQMYSSYAYTMNLFRGAMSESHYKRIRRELRKMKREYEQLPDWWGMQEELPF